MLQNADLSVIDKSIANQSKVFSKNFAFLIIALELFFSFPIGFALSKLPIGGIAWILGGIASGALVLNIYSILYKNSLEPHKTIRKIGQILVGIVIGCSIVHSNLAGITGKLPIFVFLTLFMLLSGTFIGYIYSKISQTNLLNAMLATVPGGVGIMSSIAADYGRNVSLVALVQVIRVTTVIMIIPVIARLSTGNFQNSIPSLKTIFDIDINRSLVLIVILGVAFLGAYIAKILKVPAAPFFGALIVGVSFNYLVNLLPFIHHLDFNPPRIVNVVGQALLGISIGEYWGSKPNLDKKTILYALVPVGMTILAGFIAAAIAKFLTPWDWLTCMLVTAPGGSAEMILVSLALNHNVEIVTAGHLVRLIAIHASLPLWLLLFQRLESSISNHEQGNIIKTKNLGG